MTAHEGASRKQAAVTMHDEQVATHFIVGNGGPVGWTDRAKLAALIAQVREDAERSALERAAKEAEEWAQDSWREGDAAEKVLFEQLAAAIRSLMT